jgi:hypothetical protein
MSHTSAISNTYYMQQAPKQKTPITFAVGKDRSHCYGCGREILPRIIQSKFIGSRKHTLAVCPCCNSVVQDPPKPAEPKKKVSRTVFVWVCRDPDCACQYPEMTRLPVALSPKGVTCRVCPECFEEVRLVEKQVKL